MEGKDTDSTVYKGHTWVPELERGRTSLELLSRLLSDENAGIQASTGVMELAEEEFQKRIEVSPEAVYFEYYDVKKRGHPLELFPELPGEEVAPLWSILLLVKRQPHIIKVGSLSRFESNVFEIHDSHLFVDGSKEHRWSLYLSEESDHGALYPGTRLFSVADPLSDDI